MLSRIRIFVLICFVSTKTVCIEPSKTVPKLKITEIQAKFKKYVFKKTITMRGGEQVDDDDIVTVTNTETNKSFPILGNIEGVVLLSNNILQINTYIGAHTHTVRFYDVSSDGDLNIIKHGEINSDIGTPGVYVDALSNTIVVFSHYARSSKNNCYMVMEDGFIYDDTNNTFNNLYEKKVLGSECKNTNSDSSTINSQQGG